ncbi:hypothetical protein B0A55_05636 [Friedmanniomyces simplex]|uniref:Uncharacterized protein n=1 Tax=Friedmanniomyces simplex TaxID=329884 RepID=A0A4U0X5Q9_9PEZI|nr:hypothetical protein B0A55_05636 [Friedmanniomyces simplex]
MVKQLPHAPGASGGNAQAGSTDLSEALAALTITSGALTPSASSSDSNYDEADGAQLPQAERKTTKKAAKRVKQKATAKARKAADNAEKQAKAEADQKAKVEAQKKAKDAAAQQAALYDNIIEYFDTTYGRKEARLAAWQLLCEHVGVEAGPSIIKRKKVSQATLLFLTTSGALRTYTKAGRVFPLKLAKESPVLRSMLIKVFFK